MVEMLALVLSCIALTIWAVWRNLTDAHRAASLTKERDTIKAALESRVTVSGDLVIHRAAWGNDHNKLDVERQLREKPRNAMVFHVDQNAFPDCADPAPGFDRKYVEIEYSYPGWPVAKLRRLQGEWVVLPEDPSLKAEITATQTTVSELNLANKDLAAINESTSKKLLQFGICELVRTPLGLRRAATTLAGHLYSILVDTGNSVTEPIDPEAELSGGVANKSSWPDQEVTKHVLRMNVHAQLKEMIDYAWKQKFLEQMVPEIPGGMNWVRPTIGSLLDGTIQNASDLRARIDGLRGLVEALKVRYQAQPDAFSEEER